MNDSRLYKLINVFRRISAEKAIVYRCFELIPEGGFVVQSADWIRLPVDSDAMRQHERQLWEFFCEEAPEQRSGPSASIEEAIAAFDAEFGN
ncbi:hypothetical protein [Archangium primigenium]|uniref:hypothetical protein n=1 Tax=[Archangium] primigenium TaxID=2792470 RepID=UPI00195AEA89|nr:hypothetical protein [Archangium primigenium]MBM7117781.1 hypothetical protein [Archangium primigenium]